MAKLASQFFKRVTVILNQEGVEFDKPVVAEVINKYFPDWRRVINELQRYSAVGKIDTGILANLQETSIKQLVSYLKDMNYTEVCKWVKNNLDTDVNDLYNQFYDISESVMTKQGSAQLVLHIAKYQYQNAFSANPEINFLAFLVEVMKDCEFA